MGQSIKDLMSVAGEGVKAVHQSPAVMLLQDVSLLKSLMPEMKQLDQDLLEGMQDLKDISLLQAQSLEEITKSLEHLATLPTQLVLIEDLLTDLNNKMGRMLHIQEFGTNKILETSGKTISGGRKVDLFRGYDESGRVQSVLLDLSHESVEGYLLLDSGKIEFNYTKLKEMNAFNPSGREWWISRHDDTNDRYVIQFTPNNPPPFDKVCYIRIWNRSTNDLIINVGRLVKQSKPHDIADIMAKKYGRDVILEKSKKLREEIGLKKGTIVEQGGPF